MNQSVYDITEVIGQEVQQIRDTLGPDKTAQYLHGIARIALMTLSNPAWNPVESLSNAMTNEMLQLYRDSISQTTAMVFQRLCHFLKGLPFEGGSRLLTVISVTLTPVSYQLTLGHVA